MAQKGRNGVNLFFFLNRRASFKENNDSVSPNLAEKWVEEDANGMGKGEQRTKKGTGAFFINDMLRLFDTIKLRSAYPSCFGICVESATVVIFV